jgi:hypothetical protein
MAAVVMFGFFSAQEGTAAGISTERLSPKDLRTWKSIEEIVSARDKSGRILHPTLQGLWEKAQDCGKTIYIEFPRPKGDTPHTAGNFSVEMNESGAEIKAGVIKFYLETIDNAGTSDLSRRASGFLPFENLSKKSYRYAEVLGHELVHALLTLTNQDYARLAANLDQASLELVSYRRSRVGQPMDEGTTARLASIRKMTEEIEHLPEENEIQIWRELQGGTGSLVLTAGSVNGR